MASNNDKGNGKRNRDTRGTESSPSDQAVHFEAIKVSLTQDRTGYVLKLGMHPDEVPETVLRDFVGARYMVALVRINDQGQAELNPEVERGKKAVAMAGMFCEAEQFQTWMHAEGHADDISEEAAAEGLRKVLRISSRSELKTNKEARDRFFALVAAFEVELARTGSKGASL